MYDPYATSHFQGHSLIATANIVHGIVRIVGYPLFAKVADVSPHHSPNPPRHISDQSHAAHWPSSGIRGCGSEHGPRQRLIRSLWQRRDIPGWWNLRVLRRHMMDHHRANLHRRSHFFDQQRLPLHASGVPRRSANAICRHISRRTHASQLFLEMGVWYVGSHYALLRLAYDRHYAHHAASRS